MHLILIDRILDPQIHVKRPPPQLYIYIPQTWGWRKLSYIHQMMHAYVNKSLMVGICYDRIIASKSHVLEHLMRTVWKGNIHTHYIIRNITVNVDPAQGATSKLCMTLSTGFYEVTKDMTHIISTQRTKEPVFAASEPPKTHEIYLTFQRPA